MKKRKVIHSLCLLSLFMVACESDYKVGIASVDIMPTDETVSVALAGYAGPYTGRFSLTWEDKGAYGELISVTSLQDRIYSINKNRELITAESEDAELTKVIAHSVPVGQIAGWDNHLYGISDEGDLYVCDPTTPQPIQWNKLSSTEKTNAFTSFNRHLYIATHKGELLQGELSDTKQINWTCVGNAKDIISMTSDQNRLYAVSADNILYQANKNASGMKWEKIGYNNADTYTIHIKHILHLKNKLYAFASDNHIYRGKHNIEGSLTARAMSIQKGKETAIIVGVDVCGLDGSFTNEIKNEIYQRRGIKKEDILINASHSHYVPVTQSWATWEEPNQHPDTLYLNNIVRKGIIEAIEQSIDNAVVADLFFGKDTTDIGHNRSLTGKQSVYDNSVHVLKSVAPQTNETSILFLTGCHPVFTDPSAGHFVLNANFPGYTKELLDKETNVAGSLFLQGCAGDINPKDPYKISGAKLAEDIKRIVNRGDMCTIKGEISCYIDTVKIPVTPWSEETIRTFKKEAEKTWEDGVSRRNIRWANLMLSHYEKDDMPEDMPIYIQTINIGNWKLIGLSREVTTEYGLSIKELYPEQNVSVVAYTNDVSSYLATNPHIENRDYEGYDSFFWYGQPSHFPLNTLQQVVGKIKENNR